MKNYVELFFSLNKDAIERTRTRRKIAKIGSYIISLALAICIAVCLLTLIANLAQIDSPFLPKKDLAVLATIKGKLFYFFIFTACFFALIFMVFPSSVINYFSKKNDLEAIAEEFAMKTISKDLVEAINKKFSSDLMINESFKKAIEKGWWLDDDFNLWSSMKIKLADSNLKFSYEGKEFTLKKWKYSKKGFRAIFDIRHTDGVIEKNISFELPEV